MPRTPGPWTMRRAPDANKWWVDGAPDANRGETIGAPVADAHERENAAFIVEACNAHDALTAQRDRLAEALRAIEPIASARWRSLPTDSPEKRALASARAALAEVAK